MLGRDDSLQRVEHPFVVPRQQTRKLLERADGHADRFDALAIQVRQLTGDVNREWAPSAMIAKAVRDSTDEPRELREERLQGFGIHFKSPGPMRGPEFPTKDTEPQSLECTPNVSSQREWHLTDPNGVNLSTKVAKIRATF